MLPGATAQSEAGPELAGQLQDWSNRDSYELMVETALGSFDTEIPSQALARYCFFFENQCRLVKALLVSPFSSCTTRL